MYYNFFFLFFSSSSLLLLSISLTIGSCGIDCTRVVTGGSFGGATCGCFGGGCFGGGKSLPTLIFPLWCFGCLTG